MDETSVRWCSNCNNSSSCDEVVSFAVLPCLSFSAFLSGLGRVKGRPVSSVAFEYERRACSEERERERQTEQETEGHEKNSHQHRHAYA